jgi:hypothetical protein
MSTLARGVSVLLGLIAAISSIGAGCGKPPPVHPPGYHPPPVEVRLPERPPGEPNPVPLGHAAEEGSSASDDIARSIKCDALAFVIANRRLPSQDEFLGIAAGGVASENPGIRSRLVADQLNEIVAADDPVQAANDQAASLACEFAS